MFWCIKANMHGALRSEMLQPLWTLERGKKPDSGGGAPLEKPPTVERVRGGEKGREAHEVPMTILHVHMHHTRRGRGKLLNFLLPNIIWNTLLHAAPSTVY
jgi:hypothetical protein